MCAGDLDEWFIAIAAVALSFLTFRLFRPVGGAPAAVIRPSQKTEGVPDDHASAIHKLGIDIECARQAHGSVELSSRENDALDSFRSGWLASKASCDYDPYDTIFDNDVVHRRFLVACGWDPSAALARYIRCRAWRKEKGVARYFRLSPGPHGASALIEASVSGFESAGGVEAHPSLRCVGTDAKEELFRKWCGAMNAGWARDGRPLYLERTGETATRLAEMLQELSFEDVVDRHVRQQEIAMARCREISALLGVNVHKQVLIFDMAGLSFWPNSAGLALLKHILTIDSQYYPETLGTHFIINCPRVFSALWKIISSWLDPVTKDKFRVIGSSYKEHLLAEIHPSQLPVEYGGVSQVQLPPLRLSTAKAREVAEAMLRARAEENASGVGVPRAEENASGVGVPRVARAGRVDDESALVASGVFERRDSGCVQSCLAGLLGRQL